MQISEQWILSRAPGQAAAESGRTLSEEGCFFARMKTEDDKTYWAECTGSARNPYYVSVDWSLSDTEPAFSCSCPEKKSPCKHGLGLMYEVLAGKHFKVGETPPYVWRMRSRQEAEMAKTEARLERVRRQSTAMREKKLERQLDGLEKVEKMMSELLRGGLGSISELPAQSLERLSVELGNSDLLGARDTVEAIAACERRCRQEGLDVKQCRAELLRLLCSLHAFTERSRSFLSDQLTSGRYAMEEPVLYEQLGGEWDEDELREVGMCRRNAKLIQLSFDVTYDEARRAHIERGFWAELTHGDFVYTLNTRSAKGGAAEDSCFSALDVPLLYETPSAACPRVWWDDDSASELTDDDIGAVLKLASEHIADVVKYAAAQLGDPLLPGSVPALVRVGRVGYVEDTLTLEDCTQGRIALRDRRGGGAGRASARRLSVLSRPPAEGDALFGLVYCDEDDGRYCLQPYSVIRKSGITRLQF